VTKPITHRPLRKTGAKLSVPPRDAAEQIRDLAADGWSIVGIAHRMGVDRKTFNGWLERDPGLNDAITLGREQERHVLHNIIYRKAVEKEDTTAAIMLLNSRHGYRTDQSEGRGVSVTIALPGAMSFAQFNALAAQPSSAASPAIESKGNDQ
jgi:hypothetical protein